jgi:protein-S-isoprenylcysteine O-methyltransferase Ste14
VFVLIRAVVYATAFVGLFLVFIPGRLLARAGIAAQPGTGAWQVAGMAIAAIGGAIALWCIFTFVALGRGTPAPFDPPRRLVVRGPYRYVRNPMYIGAALALLGAAIVYRSAALALYALAFLLVLHAFVLWYEEPTLRRIFGAEYEAYTGAVRRWLPLPRARHSR